MGMKISENLGYIILIVGMVLLQMLSSWQAKHRKPTVAIIYSTDQYYHSQAKDVVREWVARHHPEMVVREFSPLRHRDTMSLRLACNTALRENPDVMFVVGLANTERMVAEVRRMRRNTPVVFIGVDKPDERGFVQSLDRPGGNVTGALSYDQDACPTHQLISLLMPHSKHILVPYFYSSSQPYEEEWYQNLSQELLKRGVTTKGLSIENEMDTMLLVKSFIYETDGAVAWEGTRLINMLVGVSKRARQNKVPFLDVNLANIETSAFVYGVHPLEPARAACEIGDRILKGESPATIPVARIYGNRDLFINVPMCAQSGIDRAAIAEIERRVATEPEYASLRGHVHVLEKGKLR